jgi:ubiquinone/menaquinone biosynthesis C-methylase UbiE
MKRVAGVPELLDGDLDDPSTLGRNLRDLRRVNRLSGGAALSRRAIAFLVPPPAPVSVLDVGTGAVDIPLALLAAGRRDGRQVEVTATDSREEVLAAARALTPGLEQTDGLTLSIADGRGLPFPDDAFDVGHASLVLHHIEPDEAIGFLRELARVSRRGIVINDLSRRPITFIGAWLLSHALTTNHYSRHDAPLSARRAYTLNEARSLMARADLQPVSISRGIVGHRWAIAAVRRQERP